MSKKRVVQLCVRTTVAFTVQLYYAMQNIFGISPTTANAPTQIHSRFLLRLRPPARSFPYPLGYFQYSYSWALVDFLPRRHVEVERL